MRRPLGSFETALTLSGDHAPFVVVMVLRLAAAPEPARLRAALDRLQERHEALRARIVERGGRLVFEPDSPAIPLEVRPRRDDDAWRSVAETELGRPVDRRAGPLLRCLLLGPPEHDGRSGDAASEIVLSFHHAIMDGTSGTALAEELLALCAEPAGAETGAATPSLPAVETLFPRSWRGARARWRAAAFVARQVGDELRYRLGARGRRPLAVVHPPRCRLLALGLSREETSALVRRTRRQRVTLTGALHAALLLAVARHLHDGRPGPLRYLAFADLRPHLSPAPAAGALGSCIAMLRYTAVVGAGSGLDPFWTLARAVSRQLDAGVRRGDRYAAARLAASTMRQVLAGRMGRMGATALSYLGPVAVAEPQGALPLRGLHSFVSNLAEGPEYTAQARLLRGELGLDVVYLDADMAAGRARAIAEEALATLRAAGREAG